MVADKDALRPIHRVTYAIDASDCIVDVGDDWAAFADENEGSDHLKPETVVGESLWRYIRGATLVELYKAIFAQVRRSGEAVDFRFRCDSPGFQRRMRMRVEPLNQGLLGFLSETLSVTPREAPLSAHAYDAGFGVLKRCSICNLFELSDGDWTDAVTAVQHDAVLDRQGRIQIVWTVCPHCRKELRAMADRAAL
ncbi:hypothetical protein [Botrimarina mediterranea]|uniref:Uncharacterized protein n=1 Tax=Botrimarina mediterranea TaxID=2528022 RepID=A0A518K4A1_9BACT|nr:hypothetical protein [Botrimarina mediterranea]QDV72619.1 hypothetical protein Spa11_07990 [Botrimarina mediterranea]QDV77191.1 hypothetical protein K2D_07800 [Planctomycetes bacterium K2D]